MVTWLVVLKVSVCDYLVHGLGGLCLWPTGSGAASLRWSRASWLKVVQKQVFYLVRPGSDWKQDMSVQGTFPVTFFPYFQHMPIVCSNLESIS